MKTFTFKLIKYHTNKTCKIIPERFFYFNEEQINTLQSHTAFKQLIVFSSRHCLYVLRSVFKNHHQVMIQLCFSQEDHTLWNHEKSYLIYLICLGFCSALFCCLFIHVFLLASRWYIQCNYFLWYVCRNYSQSDQPLFSCSILFTFKELCLTSSPLLVLHLQTASFLRTKVYTHLV